MEVLLALYILILLIIVPIWIFTETPKGKKWIKNL